MTGAVEAWRSSTRSLHAGHPFNTSISPSCSFALIFFATSSAILRVRQRISNFIFLSLPFQTAYLPPSAITTRTLPMLGGIEYFIATSKTLAQASPTLVFLPASQVHQV